MTCGAQIDVADFVEKERAAFGHLEPPFLATGRTRERPFLVAEELRLDQCVGQRRAADLHERLLRAQRVVVDCVRDQLLAGARFAANQHRRVRLGHLGHLLVHLPGRSARPDDVREVVALAQFLTEVRVLVNQAAPFLLDEPLHVERLRNHRADDAEKLNAAVEVALRLEPKIDGESAYRCAALEHRHANKAELLLGGIAAPGGAVEQRRLAADAGHHDWLAALDDLSRNAFADAVADGPRAVLESLGGLDVQLAVAQQGEHAPDDAVMADQDREHALHRCLQVEGAGQRLAHLQQSRQAPRVACGGARFGGCNS